LHASNPRNEVFCLAFNDRVELLRDFTSDYAQVESALGNLESGGGTALYDAIISGLEKLKNGKHKRRALVVITDGGDQHSRHTLTSLIDRAQRSDAQVYTVGFFNKSEEEIYKASGSRITLVDGREVDNPGFVFKTLAEETGAETFFPRSEQELNKATSDIASGLRYQYALAYYPEDQTTDDRYREIQVRIRGARAGELKIKARKGYRMSRSSDGDEPEEARVRTRDGRVVVSF